VIPIFVERYDQVPVDGIHLEAEVVVPQRPTGVVIFAHGSGSGRMSPRNRYVAGELQQAGLATVLADLLTIDEEVADARAGMLRFDIPLLASRVVALVDWMTGRDDLAPLGVGLFGASTGAAAALVAAAARPDLVQSVVSRGGRPDLAYQCLAEVRQPTLLIVGELDPVVLELNREALARLDHDSRLVVVPGATHLFEEPGALEHVARLAVGWFT
jgi:pimeloyl-ACP methyl ester carboxylesterase